LVRDGVGLEELDLAAKNFGMPVGPIDLADNVGIDVVYHVASFLSRADLGNRMSGGDITFLEEMVKKGWLGKKSNKGFYTYKGKRKPLAMMLSRT
jgi:3-hydroxyacyl-CoA dehydrogenase